MSIKYLWLFGIVFCCVFGGCAVQEFPLTADARSLALATAGTDMSDAALQLGPESRLGVPYLSALNELCYEVFPANGPAAQSQALCKRGSGWVLLPPIYMNMTSLHAASLQGL